MKWLKGMVLLLIANVLIFVTLSITFNVLVNFVLPAFGIDVRGAVNQQDLVWAIVIGFGGAFLSLAFSKQMARAMLANAYQITQPRSQAEQLVHSTVRDIAQRVHVEMPEVWIYESDDPNAFATGPTKNNSMVAVSTGLLNNLDEKEVRAVLAHEMGHVFNGDMFTTTVLAGLMNTFVYFVSRWVYRNLAERNEMLAFGVYIFLQVFLSFLAMIPISWFSRRREYGADAFSAKVYGRDGMISALRAIDRWAQRAQMEYSTQDPLATMKISGKTGGFMHLFATHPPIEARIEALRLI
jgi:heat shock protein HtpX